MNPDKLEALRKLAADERTPVEEARNAALQFVRNGGKIASEPRPPTDEEIRRTATPERIREVFRTDFDDVKRQHKEAIGKLESERDELRRERDALRKQIEDVRMHGKALLAFIQDEPVKPKEQQRSALDPWGASIFGGMPRVAYQR